MNRDRQGVDHRGQDVRQDTAQPGARSLIDSEQHLASKEPGYEGEEKPRSRDTKDHED